MVSRVVAAYDLAAGTRLDDAYVAVRDIPAQYAASDTLDPAGFTRLVGGVLAVPLKRGDPVQPAHFVANTGHTPLSAQLASGRRAITLPVDEISALSGLLQPGDLVDLYVSFTHRKRRITAPLLQGVKVLATGRRSQEAEPQNTAYSTVTLEASPADAVKLVAARQHGAITAILRHRNDGQPALAAAQGDLARLLGLEEQTKPPRTVQILYGDRIQEASDLPIAGENVDRGNIGLFQVQTPADFAGAPSSYSAGS
jgi:pilus assembly protein CpaB